MLFAFFIIFHHIQGFNYNFHGLDWSGLCSTVLQQSPIDINTELVTEISSESSNYWYLDLYYNSIRVLNRNLTASASITSGFSYSPGVNFDILANFGNIYAVHGNSKTLYKARMVSFHYPAEHTFNAKQPGEESEYKLEVQIQHVSASNSSDLLILSVLFRETGSKSYFLKQIIDSFYNPIGSEVDCTFATGGWYVVKNFFSYKGTETRPPCDSGVTWVISSDIQNATKSQIEFFSTRLNVTNIQGNFRYTMPQLGREIFKYTEEVFSQSLFFVVISLKIIVYLI